MGLEPAQEPPIDIEQVLFLLGPVAFAGIDDQLGLHTEMLQAAMELLRLADRVDQVVLGVENQRRCLGVLQVRDR